MMLTCDFGTFTFRMMVVADIASGCEMIPPKRKPNAKVKPGISALETNATTHEVMITMGKAKLIIPAAISKTLSMMLPMLPRTKVGVEK